MPRPWAPKVFRPATVRVIATWCDAEKTLCNAFLQGHPMYRWCDMVAERRQFLDYNRSSLGHDRFASR